MPFTVSQAVRDCVKQCEPIRMMTNQVYLISRFDDDDSTLNVTWDAGYTPVSTNYFKDGKYYYGNVTKLETVRASNAVLLDDNDRPVRGRAGVVKGSSTAVSSNQGGGHAEEFFLMKLKAFIEQFYCPTTIEIYVSRIPCAATSMQWRFSFYGGSYMLPVGCGAKLYTVIKFLNVVNWYVAYGEGYRGASQSASLAWITKINALPNAEAGHISKFI